MEKQAGPFARMRVNRMGYSPQQPYTTNFNPVQGQMSSIGYSANTTQNTDVQQPKTPVTTAPRVDQNIPGNQVNFPSATNLQVNQPKMQPVQMSKYYRDSMQAIRQMNDFSKYTPEMIQAGLQDAVNRGAISQQESQMLQNEFNTRYNQWQKRLRGSVATKPSAQPTTSPVVRNQENTIDNRIDELGTDINNFANEDGWDTSLELEPNKTPVVAMGPEFAGPGADFFNYDIPLDIPVMDENGRIRAHGQYLTPEQSRIYQQNMADEVIARERDAWNRTRIQTGGTAPEPMEWMPDKDREKEEAYHQRVRKLNAEYKDDIAAQRQALQAKLNIDEAAEYAQNQQMPMSGAGYEQQSRNPQPTREEQIIKKQRELSGRLARLGGRNYGYLGGNASPEQLADRENEARNWLASNPNHPNALKVRQLIRELDQIRGGQSPQIARR